MWQEGIVDGFFYQIYANGEASLAASRSNSEWTITVTCANDGCEKMTNGAPTDRASRIASLLEQCLLQSELPVVSVEPQLEAPVETQAADVPQAPLEQPVLETKVVEVPAAVVEQPVEPCGLAAVPEGGAGITLQRLLVLAGADPGAIDGFPGQLTRQAMTEALGAPSAGLETQDAIAALDRLLCGAAE
jgi:hypothetical protein